RDRSGSREIGERTNEVTTALRLSFNRRERAVKRRVGRSPLHQVLRIAEDHPERVVQLVGEAGNQRANGPHLARLQELLLGFLYALETDDEFLIRVHELGGTLFDLFL